MILTPVPMCGFYLTHQWTQFSTIPTKCPTSLTQFWPMYLDIRSQVKGSALQDCPSPTPPLRCQSSPGCHLCLWLASYRSEVPKKIPTLGLSNLLEKLTGGKETFYLLDYGFSIRGYNSELPSGIDAQGRLPRPLWVHHSPGSACVHHPGSSLNPVLLEFFGGFTT